MQVQTAFSCLLVFITLFKSKRPYCRAEMVARILSCAQNLFDKCIFDAELFTWTQMAEKNAFLARRSGQGQGELEGGRIHWKDMEFLRMHGMRFLLFVRPFNTGGGVATLLPFFAATYWIVYFALINLNMKLCWCAKSSFSLLLIFLGQKHGLYF